MGLRAHSLAWVAAFTVVCGGLGAALLGQQLLRSFERIEDVQLRRDFQRLRGTLAEAVQQRERGAREWSHWTALRDYALRPDAGFAAENLGPTSISASGLQWLAVLSLDGRALHAAHADPRADAEAIARTLLDPGHALGRRLRAPPPGQGACGLDFLVALGSQPVVLCHLPIRDSGGAGAPAGILLSVELLDQAKLQAMGERAALDFSVLPAHRAPALSGAGPEAFELVRGESSHRLRARLSDLAGAPAVLLELRWPRELRVHTRQVLFAAQLLLAALALLLALGAYCVVDWRLVRRLLALKGQLAAARTAEDWSRRFDVGGRDEIAELADEANHLMERIEQQLRELEAHALSDPLTGLANRRAFDRRLAEALSRCARNGQPLCLLMVDADHFKLFNDRHGHPAGDRALQVVARGLSHVARRAGDMAARLGGEEFVLLFEGLELKSVDERAAQLRAWMAAQRHGDGAALAQPLSLSLGLARARPGDTEETLLARADAALYRAKQGGRDRLERDD